MTRFAALVVAALGRSPYVDEIVTNSDQNNSHQNNSGQNNTNQQLDSESDRENSSRHPYVQQYDARGHPINLETRHRERMEVQAGNEVLQAAGIVETCAAREERERSEEEEKLYEKESGLQWNRSGHRVLIAGVWGVSGLRRRIILYELYSRIPFPAILRREKYHHGLYNFIFPGSAVETLAHLFTRADWLEFEKSFSRRNNSESRTFASKLTAVLVKCCGFGLEYARTYLRMFALLQQLNLIDQDQILPSLHSLIPFSRDSLIQFPAAEGNFRPTNAFGFLHSSVASLVIVGSPIALVYLYGNVLPAISNYLFNPCYALALKPAVTPRNLRAISSHGWSENLTGRAFLQALKNNGFAPSPRRPDPREIHESHAVRTLLNNKNPTYYELRDESASVHRNEALRLLEGGPSEEIEIPEEEWDSNNATNPTATGNGNGSNNNTESTQVSWASMISVEVVDHGPRQSLEQQGTNVNANPVTAGASAELHEATNTPPTTRNSLVPKPDEFHITYLTMLPSILLGRTLSTFISHTLAIPLEILMIRTVASSYLRHHPNSTTLVSEGIYTRISIPRFRGGNVLGFMTNLLAAHMLVLGTGTLVWAAYSKGSMYFRRKRVSRERGPVEIEVAGEPY